MYYNPFSLEGKTILVTGASSGIGKAVAIECSKFGANVVITARNEERLKETHSSLDTFGNHSMIIAEVTEQEQVIHLVSECPVLDGVVLCAGVNDKTLVKNINQDKIDKMFKTNVFGPMLISKECVKQKKLKAGASIAMISSIAAGYATISNALYASSKGALESFIKVLALELAPRQIRVNAIRPGMVETPILSAYAMQDQLEGFKKDFPLGRFGKPEEIAYGVVYLLSDAAKWMTGSIFNIDGGITLR